MASNYYNDSEGEWWANVVSLDDLSQAESSIEADKGYVAALDTLVEQAKEGGNGTLPFIQYPILESCLSAIENNLKIVYGTMAGESRFFLEAPTDNWVLRSSDSDSGLSFDIYFPENMSEGKVGLVKDCSRALATVLNDLLKDQYFVKMIYILANQFVMPNLLVFADYYRPLSIYDDGSTIFGMWTAVPDRLWLSYYNSYQHFANRYGDNSYGIKEEIIIKLTDTMAHELCHCFFANLGFFSSADQDDEEAMIEDLQMFEELVDLLNMDRNNLIPYMEGKHFAGELCLNKNTQMDHLLEEEAYVEKVQEEIVWPILGLWPVKCTWNLFDDKNEQEQIKGASKNPEPKSATKPEPKNMRKFGDPLNLDLLDKSQIVSGAEWLEEKLFICNQNHPMYQFYWDIHSSHGVELGRWVDVILYEEILCRFMGIFTSKIPLETLQLLLPNSFGFFQKHFLQDCINRSFSLIVNNQFKI